MKMRWIWMALLAFAGAARAQSPACTGDQDECSLGSLLAAEDALQSDVAARGIAAAFTDVLDEDSTYIATLQPLLTGKAAIVAYLQSTFADPAASTLTWTRARGDVSQHGDLGYTFGWTLDTVASNPPRPGHYIAVWRREREPNHRKWVLESYLRYHAAPMSPPPSWFGPLPQPDDVGNRVNPTKALSALEVLDSEFAALSVAQGQAAAHQEFAAPDAVEMLTDVTFGKDAIVAAHVKSDPGTSLNWAPSGGGMARSGDLGYTIGHYVFTVTATTPVQTFPGHYLTVFKRQPDGQWRYVLGSGTFSLLP